MKILNKLIAILALSLVVAPSIAVASDTDLCNALIQRKTSSLESIISDGANVNCFSPQGFTPLTLAAYNGDISAIQTLLSHGATIDSFDRYGNSALTMAITRGHAKAVDELLSKGADINKSRGDRGQTPLGAAIWANNKTIINNLISKGADLNLGTGEFTPLSLAVFKADLSLVKLLVDAGADVDKGNPKLARTPLMIAAAYGRLDIMEYLLDKKAAINATDSEGKTALFWAERANESESIKFLKKNKATK